MFYLLRFSFLSTLLFTHYATAQSCPTPGTNPKVQEAYAIMEAGSTWESQRGSTTIYMSFVTLAHDPGNASAKQFYSNPNGVFKIGYNSSAGGWECRRHIEITGVRNGIFQGNLVVEACNPAFQAAPLDFILSHKGASHPSLSKLHYALTLDQLSKGASQIRFEKFSNGTLARFKIPMTSLKFEESSVGQGCRMIIRMEKTKQKDNQSFGWSSYAGYASTSRYYTWDLSLDRGDGFYRYFNKAGKQKAYTPR